MYVRTGYFYDLHMHTLTLPHASTTTSANPVSRPTTFSLLQFLQPSLWILTLPRLDRPVLPRRSRLINLIKRDLPMMRFRIIMELQRNIVSLRFHIWTRLKNRLVQDLTMDLTSLAMEKEEFHKKYRSSIGLQGFSRQLNRLNATLAVIVLNKRFPFTTKTGKLVDIDSLTNEYTHALTH